MTTRLITPPAELAVSLDDAKNQFKIELDDISMDDMVTIWLKGVIAYAQSYMQRSIINQTWRLTLDRFPDALKLYYPPIVSVSHVKYYDTDNVLRTLDPEDYTVDIVSEPGYIVPAPDVSWPDIYDRINAVEVQYIAGYGADSTSTPDDIRLYILAKVVEQFGPGAGSGKATIQSSFLDRLLDEKKIWSLG